MKIDPIFSQSQERRKSLRHSATRSTPLFSSDEEDIKHTGAKKTKRTKKTTSPRRKTTRASATPTKKTTRASATPTKKTTVEDSSRKYNLRSRAVEFSSEDELALDITAARSTKATRMSLSESRFMRQLDDIKKGKYSTSPHKTSTPQKTSPKLDEKEQTSSPSKVQATKKLLFDSSVGSSTMPRPTMMTRRQQRLMEESVVAEAPPTVAQADDEEPDYPPPVKKIIDDHVVPEPPPAVEKTEEEQSFPVTWKEFALAAFVTGLAALGYVCYTTDYCRYC